MGPRRWARWLRVVGCGVVSLFGGARGLAAQDNQPMDPPPPPPGVSAALDSSRAARGAAMSVSVLIYGPGDAVFERFGHIAIAIADAATGENLAFNWGMFDFNQPNFLGRFLTGDTKYWMAGYPTYAFNAAYQAQNRTIRQLRLSLTPVERGALADFVAWNAQEQNKYYRYDYYRDNCATRVRDALDWVLRGAVRRTLDVPGAGRTWRGETARITASDLPVFSGIHVALGRNADQPLSQWDEAFLPDYLGDHLSGVTVNGQSLVASNEILFQAAREPMPVTAPKRIVGALMIGLVLAALVSLLDARPAPVTSRLLTGVGVLWYAVGGLLGTVLLLAATVTKHAPYMGANLTLMLVHPLWLLTAVLWPKRNAAGRLGRAAAALAVLLMVLSTAGALLALLPAWRQGSAVVMAVVLPVTQALGLVGWRLMGAARGVAPRTVMA